MQREAIKILLRLVAWRPDLSLMVILLSGLCVLYRIEDIWGHRSLINLEGTSLISQANAAPEVEPTVPVVAEPDSKLKELPASAETNGPKKEEFDPLNLDENQVKILKAMAKKEGDATIVDDRAEIVKKEEMVKIAEEKISDKIKQLDAIRQDINDTKDALTKQEQANIEQMVKIYEGMKPAQAAEIFNKLEVTALSQIVKAMKPKKAGLIMANMDQAKARTVTLVLLEDRNARLAQKAAEAEKEDSPKTETPAVPK